jgi:hypothetical protein
LNEKTFGAESKTYLEHFLSAEELLSSKKTLNAPTELLFLYL